MTGDIDLILEALSRGYENCFAGRFAEAADAFAELIRAAPTVAEAHYILAVSLYELECRQEAAAAVRQAIGLNPNSGPAHHLLARLLRDLGEDAKTASTEAARLRPDLVSLENDVPMPPSNGTCALPDNPLGRLAIRNSADVAELHISHGR